MNIDFQPCRGLSASCGEMVENFGANAGLADQPIGPEFDSA